MYRIIKMSLYVLFATLSVGCASKMYTSPSLGFTVKDALDQQRIEGVKLTVGSLFDESLIATSNSNGEIKIDSIYELKLHLYPFSIPSHGMALPALFNIKHQKYSDYNVYCMFTSLGDGECSPVFVENLVTKKSLMFECETCCTYKTIVGRVKALENGSETQYQFSIEDRYKRSITSEYYEIILPKLNNQQIEMAEKNEKFYIDVLLNGSCSELRLPYDSTVF